MRHCFTSTSKRRAGQLGILSGMDRRSFAYVVLGCVCVLSAAPLVVRADAVVADPLQRIVAKAEADPSDIDTLRKLGAAALSELAKIYERSDPDTKVRIARLFYKLGSESRDAKRVLMRDVHTNHPTLRLEVQWALGRVSADDDVVDVLVDNMNHDANALFRDKAACGLANDQIHLNPRQRARLLRKVIASLASSTAQVRTIAKQVLQILTGQNDAKGFNPTGPEQERQVAIARWQRWLAEYEANL